MATLGITEPATTDLIRSDGLRSKQVMRQPAVTRNTPGESNRVEADVRVLNVLVLGAEQDTANALVRQIRSWGHAGHMAWVGFATPRLAVIWRPDVVLLDLGIPLIAPCQVAKQLRSDYLSEDCLIIAVTEWADDARREQCIEAGIDLVLIKPVDQDVVETLLMLESVRVNRRRMRKAVNNINRRTSMDDRPVYIRSKPC